MEDNLTKYVSELKKGKIENLNYYKRIKIERDLYLRINSFIKKTYGIELGGFSEFRKRELIDMIKINKISKRHADIIYKGFEICNNLRVISTSDPYGIDNDDESSSTEKEQKKLGISIEKIVLSLSEAEG